MNEEKAHEMAPLPSPDPSGLPAERPRAHRITISTAAHQAHPPPVQTAVDLTSLSSKLPQSKWQEYTSYLTKNPRLVKRVIKTAITLSSALAITISRPLVDFHGSNPFLLGTAAIYLFPIKSVGAQLVSTIISLLGVLLGLAFSNLTLFLANMLQDDPISPSNPRRTLLWCFFVFAAWVGGYIRSKHPRLYLLIVFFMITNMFAIIRGINKPEYVFRDYFPVITFGAGVSFIVSLCLWPEDHSKALKSGMQSALAEARQVLLDMEKSLCSREYREVVATGLSEGVKKVGTLFRESDYEISLARVDGRALAGLNRRLETVMDLLKIYNCAVRARRIPETTTRGSFDDGDSQEKDCLPPTPANQTTPAETNKRRAISFTFLEAVRVIDMITDRIESAYGSKTGTRDIPPMELSGFEKYKDAIQTALAQERENRTEADIDEGGVEGVALMDLLGGVIMDILNSVLSAAREGNEIQSTGRLRLFLPLKFRGVKEQSEATQHITSCEPTPSGIPVDGAQYILEDEDADDDTGTEFVLLRDNSEKWFTKLSMQISRTISKFKHSRHVKYAVKFSIVMGVLSSPAFVGENYIWYEDLRSQWALISAMVAMETTRGMTFRTAGMKVCGAVGGGVCAFMTVYITRGKVWGDTLVALVIGVLIGYLVNDPKFAKAGTVFALAFNIIIGVSQTSPDHDFIDALARRLLTLPIGLLVAMLVHVGFFPFHARAQLGKSISTSMDWLHHLLYAIELAGDMDNPGVYPYSPGGFSGIQKRLMTDEQFDDVINKTKRTVRFANSLVPATRYEISLAGRFPVEKFQGILERLGGIVLLITESGGATEKGNGKCGVGGGPVLLDPRYRGRIEAWGRKQLLASLCNDLLVLSHTLSAKLYMPRHTSHSSIVLQDYIRLFTPAPTPPASQPQTGPNSPSPSIYHNPAPTPASTANYADVGLLSTLVNELNLLRNQVDNLISDSHINRSAKEMFPRIASANVTRAVSRCQSNGDLRGGLDGSTVQGGTSRVVSKVPSRAGTPGPAYVASSTAHITLRSPGGESSGVVWAASVGAPRREGGANYFTIV